MKTKFSLFVIALALISCMRGALAQPALGLAPAGKQSLLYWAYAPTNYIVQRATNMAMPVWVTVTDIVPVTAVLVSNNLPASFFRLIPTNLPTGMALVPLGSFTMGDTLDGESDASPTNIYASEFYMDTNLVNFGQWQTVYSAAMAMGYSFVHAGSGKGTNFPVETVDWFDCVKWCNARSQLAGLTPVYYSDASLTQVYKSGEAVPYVNWRAIGFRLPTEAEWEKAARGGAVGQRFPWGNTISESQANYFGSTTSYSYDLGPNGYNTLGNYPASSVGTTPVGSFQSNGYGLYDMAGNVWEWCWDWYGTPYGQPASANPTGPSTGTLRVLRGGPWNGPAYYERCATRGNPNPTTASDVIGFRCVSSF